MKKFLLTINFIVNPNWWVMNNSYNETWDKKLNHLLDNHKLEIDNYHTAELDGITIWIANYPYAYGVIWGNPFSKNINTLSLQGRPSRLTIYRLRQRVKIDRMSVSELRDFKLSKLL